MRNRILVSLISGLFVVFGFCFAKWSVDFSQWDACDRGFMFFFAIVVALFISTNPFMNDD